MTNIKKCKAMVCSIKGEIPQVYNIRSALLFRVEPFPGNQDIFFKCRKEGRASHTFISEVERTKQPDELSLQTTGRTSNVSLLSKENVYKGCKGAQQAPKCRQG